MCIDSNWGLTALMAQMTDPAMHSEMIVTLVDSVLELGMLADSIRESREPSVSRLTRLIVPKLLSLLNILWKQPTHGEYERRKSYLSGRTSWLGRRTMWRSIRSSSSSPRAPS